MEMSPHHRRLLQMVAGGFTRCEISRATHNSHSTIEKDLAEIRQGMGAKTTVHAVVLAIQNGDVDIEEAYLSIICKRRGF